MAKIIPRLATGYEGEVVNTVGAIGRILIGAGLGRDLIAEVRGLARMLAGTVVKAQVRNVRSGPRVSWRALG